MGDSGALFLWAHVYSERWSAFAPGFRELKDNEVPRPEDCMRRRELVLSIPWLRAGELGDTGLPGPGWAARTD